MKKINFKKILNGRNAVFLLLILASVFLFGHLANAAAFGEWAGNVVGGIVALFIRAIASILIVLVNVLMSVAAYSDFIHAPAVEKGWVVVRDLCNMFFVVILLIIAFATILGQEEYGAKKMLPKLIMAAVLINFSKLICGLMIDISNVVMLTFVNAFSAIGAGNLLDLLGISDVTKIAVASDSSAVTFGTIVSAYIFGLIYVIIATVVVASMLGMLVIRLVMIWILVVLSPLAFFLQAVPGASKYSGQWWSKWTSNLLVGPVIAFFLWLSFAALQGATSPITASSTSSDLTAANADAADTSGLGSKAGTPAAMAKFVIAIGMLLGGMQIAQSVGSEAGSALSMGMSKLNKGKTLALGAVTGAGVALGKRSKEVAIGGVGKLANSSIFNKNEKDLVTGKRKGTLVGDFATQWKDDLVSTRNKEKVASREKYLKKIGIGEKAAEKGTDLINNAKTQTTGRISRSALNGAAYGTAFGGVGTAIGGVVGGFTGYKLKKNYDKAKADVKSYGNSAQETTDKATLASLKTNIANAKATGATHTWSTSEEEAVARLRKHEKNKKIADGNGFLDNATGGPKAFDRTDKAMGNMIKKKKAAKDWVKIASNEPDLLKNMNKPSEIYSSAGLSETWKKRFEELNSADPDSVKAIDNMVAEVNDTTAPLHPKKMEAMAKALAAFKKGKGNIDSATLGRLDSSLVSKGYDSSTLEDKVSTQYKQAGAGMKVNAGSGALQYNTFAQNSAGNVSKDIMGASFEKINNKAKDLGIDYKLDSAAGVNQASGAQLSNLSKVMSSLIDDEISALQKVGGEVNAQKISQLNTAKSRLASGSISGMSLKNTDVSYEGATASERRRAEYNTTQHEIMHQSGAKNEELVDDSASALQDAKLVGHIPQSDPDGGKRYDAVIGQMIANMEKANADPDAIREAIDSQIEKWSPSNAQRVVETESGKRDSLKDVNPDTEAMAEKFDASVDKLISHLDKGSSSESGNTNVKTSMSVDDHNFFMRTFNQLKKTVSKGDELIGNKLKPLSAMAAEEENKE